MEAIAAINSFFPYSDPIAPLIVNRRRQGEMNTSLVIQDTGFHAQQVVTLALHKVRIIAFLLKLLCFEEIARIESYEIATGKIFNSSV